MLFILHLVSLINQLLQMCDKNNCFWFNFNLSGVTKMLAIGVIILE